MDKLLTSRNGEESQQQQPGVHHRACVRARKVFTAMERPPQHTRSDTPSSSRPKAPLSLSTWHGDVRALRRSALLRREKRGEIEIPLRGQVSCALARAVLLSADERSDRRGRGGGGGERGRRREGGEDPTVVTSSPQSQSQTCRSLKDGEERKARQKMED
ncbi:hypothetical protein NQZ68_025683 [Dissostichus eleginoides]|nr:hypothetical protein NQZ68_025683 [Dissostichus eleginoides]